MVQFTIYDIGNYSNNYFLPQYLDNVACIKHLHYSAEVVIATQGEVTINYINKDIILSRGQGIFISPFQTHSFLTKSTSKTAIFTFSLDIIQELAAFLTDKEIKEPIFTLSEELLSLCENYDYTKTDTFYAKAILYPICKTIIEQCELVPSKQKETTIFFEIIKFTAKNFKEEISLESVANHFGLNLKYLSRMFKAFSGMRFSDYINGLRCTYALLAITNPINSEKNLSEIAYEAGFGSIRNFNRIFKKLYGTTPCEAKRMQNSYLKDV